jgi:hypothetical protein
MIANILMLVGGLAWLAGELTGVFVKSKAKRTTTSGWVWYLEAKYPILRVFIGVFVLSLFGHFMFHTWLLP